MTTHAAPEQVRLAMRLWASGVTIVTSVYGNERHGMTVSSFTSISLDPPLLMAALQKTTRTSKLILRARAFGVTILSAGQDEISERFAGRNDHIEDRLEGLEIETLSTGAPFLKGGLAYFDCRLYQTMDAGTSLIFVGEVVAAKRFKGRPLLYHDRGYARIA
ncbi:MAG TPA: flavin reductase family protein [Anaerolineales bacterium]|nr:flavin reductase family protein [Anaerolineales bacterium]